MPHHGLTHLKEYDIKDSNIELIGTEIDHKIKYNSEATEPACEIVFRGSSTPAAVSGA